MRTIVAHEGGPGYATTDSSDYFLDLLRSTDGSPSRSPGRRTRHRAERSDRLPEAQSYVGDWVENAARAASSSATRPTCTPPPMLPRTWRTYSTTSALTIDLYGDSYGSFFAQTFAARYPKLVRSAVFDGTYPIEGLDPWYSHDRDAPARQPPPFLLPQPATCPVARRCAPSWRRVVTLRNKPITTTAPDGTGTRCRVTLTPRRLLDTLLYSDVTPGYMREIPAALVALLDGNARPLARMVAEVEGREH